MREEERHAFRHIQAGPAADTDHEVRSEFNGILGARNGRIDGHIRQGGAVDEDREARGLQLADQRAKIGVCRKARVGDDQRTPAERGRDAPERMALAGSEEQFARRPQCAE